MVADRLVAVYPVLVFEISFTSEEKSEVLDHCHLMMVPVWPLSVKLVEFVPVQTVVPPDIEPPAEAAFTKIESVLL